MPTQERIGDIIRTDKEASDLLEYLLDDLLSPELKEIFVADLGISVTIQELCNRIMLGEKNRLSYIKALLKFIQELPHRNRQIRDEVESIFRRSLLNHQELLNEIEALELKNNELAKRLQQAEQIIINNQNVIKLLQEILISLKPPSPKKQISPPAEEEEEAKQEEFNG